MKRVAPRKKITTAFLIKFYEAAQREKSIEGLARAVDTTFETMRRWLKRFPELAEAKKIAEKKREATTFKDYVFKHLSPEAREIWGELEFWKSSDKHAEKALELLDGKPKKLLQELFIHALIANGFNPSEACHAVNITYSQFEYWRANDLEFLQMVEEIEWHKKNFYEQALHDLVGERNVAAVMFANRTKNADRGYSEKLNVEHSGSVSVGFSIDQLHLPLEVRKQVLAAIRDCEAKEKMRRDQPVLPPAPAAIDI